MVKLFVLIVVAMASAGVWQLMDLLDTLIK